jgi:hypothetical protein
MLWNSTVAFVVAQMIVILLHESAPTVTSLLQGYQATQFAGEVRFTPGQTPTALVVTALAGPVFSLVSGLVAMMFRPFRGHGFGELLWAWIAFLSAQEGFGYLTIAPIITSGDTGVALSALRAPGWLGWLSCAIGLAGTVFLARRFAAVGVRFTRDLYEIRAFCFYAWLIATGVLVVLSTVQLAITPGTSIGAVVAIIAGSASLGIFAPIAMSFWQRVRVRKELLDLAPVPRAAIAAAVALALLNILVLSRGVHLG